MLTAFFESIKYVGHLYPIAVLRIFVGYFWFNKGYSQYVSGIFSSQVYLEDLKSQDLIPRLPDFYQFIFNNLISHYWTLWSNGFVFLEMILGLGLIFGFLTRPFGVIAIFISMHYVLLGTELVSLFYTTLCAVLLTLIFLGAGRCVGFDYYFYKRNRGILW